jgi:hypothetical protein
VKTCIGCEHNVKGLSSIALAPAEIIPQICWGCYTWYRDNVTIRKHYTPNLRTCVGCIFNYVGVAYMSTTAFNLNRGATCFFCYPWDEKNARRDEYVSEQRRW